MRSSTPGCWAETSTSTLSVSSSTSASPTATASPSFFSQRATRASTTDSPISGTVMLGMVHPGARFERARDELLLILRVPRRRSFGGTRAAPPRQHGKTTSAGQLLERGPHEVPCAHVLGLFLHPRDLFEVRIRLDRGQHLAD